MKFHFLLIDWADIKEFYIGRSSVFSQPPFTLKRETKHLEPTGFEPRFFCSASNYSSHQASRASIWSIVLLSNEKTFSEWTKKESDVLSIFVQQWPSCECIEVLFLGRDFEGIKTQLINWSRRKRTKIVLFGSIRLHQLFWSCSASLVPAIACCLFESNNFFLLSQNNLFFILDNCYHLMELMVGACHCLRNILGTLCFKIHLKNFRSSEIRTRDVGLEVSTLPLCSAGS